MHLNTSPVCCQWLYITIVKWSSPSSVGKDVSILKIGGRLTKNPLGKYRVFILYKQEDFSELWQNFIVLLGLVTFFGDVLWLVMFCEVRFCYCWRFVRWWFVRWRFMRSRFVRWRFVRCCFVRWHFVRWCFVRWRFVGVPKLPDAFRSEKILVIII